MLSPRGKKELKINQRRILINSIEIGIPAPEQVFILGERHTSSGKVVGRVRNSKTLNYKSFTPHRDGLFCERIFGPVQSYICACGKQGPLTTSKGTLRFCPRCEVEYTDQRARRYRVGYIGLVSPVTHIWHLKGRPSYLSLFLGKRKKTLATLAYCNNYLVEQGFTKVDVNGMFTQPSARYTKQHREIGADFFKNRVLKGLKESLVIKGLTLSREQEKSKVWSLEADSIDGPFSNTVAGTDRAGCSPLASTPNRRFGTGRFRYSASPSTALKGPSKKLTVGDTRRRPVRQTEGLAQAGSGAFGKLTAHGLAQSASRRFAPVSALALRASETIKFTKAADRVESLYDLKNNYNQEQIERPERTAPVARLWRARQTEGLAQAGSAARQSRARPLWGLEQPRLVRLYSQSSTLDKQNPKRATFLKYLLSPKMSNSLPPLGQTDLHSACLPRVAALASGQPPSSAHVKRGASQKKATLSYTRSQALPFLPTFICEFHLRDGLLSFFDTFPPVEDIPIPVYCKIPRRYPLRDVHKFMADQAFSKVQVEQSSKKGRAQRASAGYRRGPFELSFARTGGRLTSLRFAAQTKFPTARSAVLPAADEVRPLPGRARQSRAAELRPGNCGEHGGKTQRRPSQVGKYSKIFCRIARRSGSFNKSVVNQDRSAAQLVAMNQIEAPAVGGVLRNRRYNQHSIGNPNWLSQSAEVATRTALQTAPTADLINGNVFSHTSINTVKNKTLPLREVLLSILLDRIVTTLIGLTPTLSTDINRPETLLTRSKARQRPILLRARRLLTFSYRTGGWHGLARRAQWREAHTRAKRSLALSAYWPVGPALTRAKRDRAGGRFARAREPAEDMLVIPQRVDTGPVAHLQWAQPSRVSTLATSSGKVRALVPLVQLAKKALLSEAEHDRAAGGQNETSYSRRKLVLPERTAPVARLWRARQTEGLAQAGSAARLCRTRPQRGLEGLRFKSPKEFWLPVIGEFPTRLTIRLLFDKGLSELPSINKAWVANFNGPKPDNRPRRQPFMLVDERTSYSWLAKATPKNVTAREPSRQTFDFLQAGSWILPEQLHRRPVEIPANLERQHGLLCFGESVEDWLESWFDRWLQNCYGANPACAKLSVWHRTVGRLLSPLRGRARQSRAAEPACAKPSVWRARQRRATGAVRSGNFGDRAIGRQEQEGDRARHNSAGDQQEVAELTQWVALAPRVQQSIGPYVTQWPEKPIEQPNEEQDPSNKGLIFTDTRNAKNYITDTVIFEDSDAPTCKSIEKDISVEGMTKNEIESLTSSRARKALNRYRAAIAPAIGLPGSQAQPGPLPEVAGTGFRCSASPSTTLQGPNRARCASAGGGQEENAKGPVVHKDGSDSYIKSQLDLQAIQEVLSYTGGGALREVLRCFDIQAFSAILLNEIKLLREYHKGYFLYEYDHLSLKAMSGDVGLVRSALVPTADVATKLTKSEQADGGPVDNTINYPLLAKSNRLGRTGGAPPAGKTALVARLWQSRRRPARQTEGLVQAGTQKQTVLHRQVGSTLIDANACSPKVTAPATSSSLSMSKSKHALVLQTSEHGPSAGAVAQSANRRFAPVTRNDYEELPEEINRFSRAIHRNARRLKIVQLLLRNRRRPEWMLISALPVLPPDLRPILQMSENLIVASDLNTLYQRVIYRNNRQYKLRIVEWSYATSLQRLVQDAVDRLIENGKGGSKPFLTPSGRPLKSLSDTLKGKKGRFRLNLLGKRVDFSGRSVIVVSPHLKIHECGLPREMALELYQYLLIRQMLLKRQVSSVILAKRVIRQQKAFVWDTLRELIYHHPLLLNRAPTLHRLGIQAFQPKLVLGSTILLHPLVCAGFNADFDGDQMGVHLPLCDEARAEAWDLLWSRNNLLSPATGEPILLPSQDMVLGFYHMSALLPSRHANSTDFKGVRPMQNRTVLRAPSPLWRRARQSRAAEPAAAAVRSGLRGVTARSARSIARTSAEANAEKSLPTSSLTLASIELERGFLRLLRKWPTESQLARRAQSPDGISDQRSLFAQELSAPAPAAGAVAHTNSNKIELRQGFGFVQINAALIQVGTPVIFKKGLRESHFFSSLDVVRAYQNGYLDIHNPIWLQWDGRIENNDSDQTPLEVRINPFGVSTQLYPSYKYRKDSNAPALGSKLSATFNLFIRTTPGRVIVNNIFPLSSDPYNTVN